MRKLSYFILGIIILFVLIFTVTPLFIGSQVKTYLNAQTTALNKKHAASISLSGYQRHWFSSDATLTVNYNVPFLLSGGCQDAALPITFTAHIQHGPLISYTDKGQKYHQLAKSLLTLTSSNMQGQINIITNWQGKTKAVFDVERFSTQHPGSSLTLNDLDGMLTYDQITKRIHYALTLAHFEHTRTRDTGEQDESISNNDTFDGIISKTGGLWMGTQHTRRDTLSITRNKASMLVVKNLQSTLLATTSADRVNYRLSMKAADVVMAGEPLGALSLDASVTHAFAPALNQLAEAAHRICSTHDANFNTLFSLSKPLYTLIQKGVTLNLAHFTLNPLESSPLHLTGSLQFIEAPKNSTILDTLKYMSANANVSIPHDLLLQQLTEYYQDWKLKNPHHTNATSASQQAKTAITNWINHTMLIEKPNNTLTAKISVKNGDILINGKAPNFELNTNTNASIQKQL